MAKLTLLQMVQDILSDMDSEEVNSINDTIEATQVSQIIKTTYYEIIDGKEWPHLRQPFQLSASGSVSLPNYMKVPETIVEVEWIRYNKKTATDTKDKYEGVIYKSPEEFINLVNARNSSDSNIDTVTDSSGITLSIINDAAPTYYTSFDDEWLIFDSYDSGVDTTLQASKSQAYGTTHPTWTVSDTFVPDLPTDMFSYLLAEAKSVAFVALKQMPNSKAEQQSNRQRYRASDKKWKVKGGINYASYGRK